MTPQEKAKQLVDRYLDINEEQEYNTPRYLTKEEAVEGALIAVDEIIESRKDDGAFDDTKWGNRSEYYSPHPMYLSYWNLVKQEINKQFMSSKEKAKELIDKFYYSLPNNGYIDKFYYSLPNNGYINEGVNSCESRWNEAVTCAIIAVDEIIKANPMLPSTLNWRQVKDELEITKTKINNNGTIN